MASNYITILAEMWQKFVSLQIHIKMAKDGRKSPESQSVENPRCSLYSLGHIILCSGHCFLLLLRFPPKAKGHRRSVIRLCKICQKELIDLDSLYSSVI